MTRPGSTASFLLLRISLRGRRFFILPSHSEDRAYSKERYMFLRRIKVKQRSRVLLIKNGKLLKVLEPGAYIVFLSPFADWKIEVHNVHNLAFRNRWSDYVIHQRPDLVEKHFHLVETTDTELAMVSVDGTLYQVLLPSRRALFWKDESTLKVEYVNLIDESDESEMTFGEITLTGTEIDKQLSALDDSTSAFLIERALERDTSSSHSKGKLERGQARSVRPSALAHRRTRGVSDRES